MEFEKFYPKIWKQNESLIITIPKDLAKANGWKEGDNMKVIIRKHEENEPTYADEETQEEEMKHSYNTINGKTLCGIDLKEKPELIGYFDGITCPKCWDLELEEMEKDFEKEKKNLKK